MSTCAERIKQLRKQKNVSQAELAEAIGVKRNTVSTWERGTRKPDFSALDMLSDFFEVSFEYILGNSDDDTPRRRPTEDELNHLAMLNLVDELYEEVIMLSRLSDPSRKIISSALRTAYSVDRAEGMLLPEDTFDISIAVKEKHED